MPNDDDVPLKMVYRTKVVIFLTVIVALLFPLPAYESGMYSGPPRKYHAWDYGTIKAPILLATEKTERKYIGFPRALNRKAWQGNGSCVPYARNKTGIKLYGWARWFLEKAPKAGYATSSVPVIGGMVITNEGGGHVAVVEDVIDGNIHVSEQNVAGLYKVTRRVISATSSAIMGYIY